MAKTPQRFTAGTNDPIVVRRVVEKLEGLLQDLRDRRPQYDEAGKCTRKDTRPNLYPHVFVAYQLGVSVHSVKKWLHRHQARRDDYEISEAFCDVYEQIATEFGESVSGVTLAIAKNPAHPQVIAAQKMVLPKTDEWMFGGLTVNSKTSKQLADYPSEMFDAMTDEQRALMRELEKQYDQLDAKTDELIRALEAQAKERKEIDTI